MKFRWSRREFLKTTTAAVVLGATENVFGAGALLPKRRLGKTGEMVSCIGFGSGTRFCSIESEDTAQALLQKAFADGVNLGPACALRGLLALEKGRLTRAAPHLPRAGPRLPGRRRVA